MSNYYEIRHLTMILELTKTGSVLSVPCFYRQQLICNDFSELFNTTSEGHGSIKSRRLLHTLDCSRRGGCLLYIHYCLKKDTIHLNHSDVYMPPFTGIAIESTNTFNIVLQLFAALVACARMWQLERGAFVYKAVHFRIS